MTSRLRVNYLCLFLVIAVYKLERLTCIVLLINMSTKTQPLIDLFVFNCIQDSLEDLISDKNSKGFVDTSYPTCSDLFGST